MRNVFVICVVFLPVLILGGCRQKNNEVFKIGAIMTQTGGVSYWSNEMQKGMDLAYDELSDLQKDKIELYYEDNMFKPNLAISAFNKLLSVNKVDLVITCFTPIANALIPLAEENRIPLMTSVTSSSNIVEKADWAFRDYVTQDQQCPILAEYIYEKMNLRKGVYIVINDDYGKDGIDQFADTFRKLGGEIIAGETFSQEGRSGRNEILKLLNQNPDFVFVIARDQLLITICNQIREINKNVQIVGVNAFDTDVVWDALGENGEGIVFTSGYFDVNNSDSDIMFFVENYRKKYSEKPNYTSIYGYSIMKYILNICETSKDRNEIRDALETLETSSIRGDVKMLDNHDVDSPIGLYIRNGGNTTLVNHN